MPFIIGNETFEKLGAIGTLSNLLIYLTTVFNLSNIKAATIISVFNGTANFGTLLGAYICDTFLGRYNTLAAASLASFLGLLLIQLTAAIPGLHPPSCGKSSDAATCKQPTGGQMSFLLTGFALMIIGAGGIRPCNLAFGVDQFNPNTESGRRGINSFFNWYFFTRGVQRMISVTLIVYIQANVSWSIGLAIPAILMLISCALFFGGTKMYVIVKASGSPVTSLIQVFVVSIKKRNLKYLDSNSLFNYIPKKSINKPLPHTDQFNWLDRAAILTPADKINSEDGSPENPWNLCSLQQVEEAKCVVRVLPIWVSGIIYYLAIAQQGTYAIFQANQADRRMGNTKFQVPAATYGVFLMLSLTAFIPVYDRVLVPFLRRLTGKEGGITILQRLGVGVLISVLSMLVSGVVEEQRRRIALTRPTLGMSDRNRGEISSMSAFWLVPQFVLAGLAEVFGAVGQVEFYYKQFPENMRSVAGALNYCGIAAGSYLSTALIQLVHRTTEGAPTGNWLPEDLNKGRLDYYYYLVGGLGVLNFGYFLWCSSGYRYKKAKDEVVQPEVKGSA
ncbi:unnamed protein product [Linum tenue]|uniref:Uncharacterized protein n=2 Tax=Linum tenue TaxID=586396 RepID=A0AAV0IQJ4_9ROSI|nr:unnamed protein product [Linum tenue]